MNPTADRPQAILLAEQLRKSYGPTLALKDVSLRLHAGEFVALLGPNGAGKSTLVQLLSGLFVPDRGHITVLGHDMATSAPRALRGLGVVFQQASLDMDLSIRANLLFHTDLHGMPRALATQRIQEGLALQGLDAQGGQSVRSLSGGNRRKVELIRAQLHQPRFLLMDEATVGLDPASRNDLVRSVHALTRSTGMAVLWTTHLVDEVLQADRLLVLKQGAIAYDGTPADFGAQRGNLGVEQAFLNLCQNDPGNA